MGKGKKNWEKEEVWGEGAGMRTLFRVVLVACLLAAVCEGKRQKSHKGKGKASKAHEHVKYHAGKHLLEEVGGNIRTVKPIATPGKDQHQTKQTKHSTTKHSKKASAAKPLTVLEEKVDGKNFEEDAIKSARSVVNEVVTMVSACKRPSTWCTSSLSME